MAIYSFDVLLFQCRTSPDYNRCFLTCIQVLQKAGKEAWYYHLVKDFPQFVVIYTVKDFIIVNETEVDVFMEFSSFFFFFSIFWWMLAIWSLVPLPFLNPWDFPSKNTGVVCHFLLQGIFLTQGLNLGLPHCRQTLYGLSHQRSLCFLRGEHIWKGSAAILLKNKATLGVVFMLPNIPTFMIIFFPHEHVICCYSLIILCMRYSRVCDITFNWFLNNSKLW